MRTVSEGDPEHLPLSLQYGCLLTELDRSAMVVVKKIVDSIAN
jgi:hypothetical protein